MVTNTRQPRVVRVIGGVLIVGAAYAVTLGTADLLEALLFDQNATEVLSDSLSVLVAGGILLGLTLGPIASRLPGSRRRQFFVWWILIYLSTVGVIVEGWAFVPDLVPLESVPWSLGAYAIVAATVAGALTVVFDTERTQGPTVPSLPSMRRIVVGIVAGMVTYVLLYITVGPLTYLLVTGPYYEQHIGGLVNPPVQVVFTVAFFRGALLSISLIPLVRIVEDSRRRAWMSALSVVVLAGFLPLIRQIGNLPFVVLAGSSVEILFQVGPTAVIVAAILGKGASRSLQEELRRMLFGEEKKNVSKRSIFTRFPLQPPKY